MQKFNHSTCSQFQDIQGEFFPLRTPERKYNSRKCYLVLPTRYSRGILPLENPLIISIEYLVSSK